MLARRPRPGLTVAGRGLLVSLGLSNRSFDGVAVAVPAAEGPQPGGADRRRSLRGASGTSIDRRLERRGGRKAGDLRTRVVVPPEARLELCAQRAQLALATPCGPGCRRR